MTAGDELIVVGGVDCHSEVHHAAALDGTGRRLGERAFPSTGVGCRQLLAWLRGFGSVAAVGVESTGSYGAGLTRFLLGAGVRVVEINQTGLKVTVRSLEVGQWNIVHRAVKPGEPRSDLFLSSFSDPVQDSSRSFAAKYRCGGVQSHWCDQEWTAKFNNALGLGGEARSKAFQELWQIAHDQNTHIPLFGLNYIHGISPKFHWDPVKRYDIVRDFTQWTLDD